MEWFTLALGKNYFYLSPPSMAATYALLNQANAVLIKIIIMDGNLLAP